jgi:phosphoribosylformimino-5-aminoimidazole carboxamide ribotide isomerase
VAFRVVPVLDLKEGRAVHAIGGRRERYQPIGGVLDAHSDPIALAKSTRDALGLDSLYLADLDAIEGREPSRRIYAQLAGLGLDLWIDAGLCDDGSVAWAFGEHSGDVKIIAGLETLKGPRALAGIIDRVGAGRAIFGLDLFEGQPRAGGGPAWGTDNPVELADRAIELGVRHVLVIDLARVGSRRGPGTDKLIEQIREVHPEIQLTAGGGVASIDDVLRFCEAGASNVLIGTSIHDGTIDRKQLERIRRTSCS